MKPLLIAVAPIAVAAVGGGVIVFGGYDDSPGGSLLGLCLVLGAVAYGARTRRSGQ